MQEALAEIGSDRKVGDYIINAVAPIRLADVGGWTDTHFAHFGKVCNIAVYPYVEVQCTVRHVSGLKHEPAVTVYAENYGLHYELTPGGAGKLPLVDAAIQRMNIPSDISIEVRIHSQVPPGASTGTSAAVSVAVIGALDMLTPGRLTPYEVARLAHKIETEDLGLQSVIQDQLASAFGGVNLIDIPEFPHANVAPIALSAPHWWDLESRLTLVYIGKPHNSSSVHEDVIRNFGANPASDRRLEKLRELAEDAKDALFEGNWTAYGAVLDANTAVQRELHPSLVSSDADRIIEIARRHGALGCKVNGAGGDGGSITVLGNGIMSNKREMVKELTDRGFEPIPVYIARQGLHVWRSDAK